MEPKFWNFFPGRTPATPHATCQRPEIGRLHYSAIGKGATHAPKQIKFVTELPTTGVDGGVWTGRDGMMMG